MTESEMMADLAAADAAGDTQLANAIASKIKALRGPQLGASHTSAPPVRPVAPAVGQAESGVRGALQGASMGWGDEAAAAVDAALPGFLRNETSREAVGQGATYGERYRSARDYYRNRNRAAETSNPGTYLAGQVAGAVAPTLVGSAPLTGTRGLAVAAGQGAAQGAGYSDAATAAGLAGDTALGAGVGVAGYGAGQILGKGASALRRSATARLGRATAKAGTQAADEAAQALASETGRLGGFSQDLNREIEWVIRLLDEEKSGTLSAANKAALDAFRKSPAYAAVVNKAAERVMAQAPAAVSRTANQEAAVAALQAAQPQAVATRTADLLKPQVGADVKSFLKSYAEPMIWALGAQQAGAALGLSPVQQGELAAAAGIIGGRTRAGKALWTRINRPGNQAALARLMGRTADAADSPIGMALRQSLATGAPALAIADQTSMDPETASLLDALRNRGSR